MAHGVCHGAIGPLTTAHLHLSHKIDLRKVTPGFTTADEITNDIDICRLTAEFSDCAEAIATAINVEQVIKDTPFRSRLCTFL